MPTEDLPRPDVPGPIAVVRDFVNTTDHETGVDELTSRADLAGYLRREGLLVTASRASADDLDLARRLRATLRRALEVNHDDPDGADRPAAVPGLTEVLSELPVSLGWTPAGVSVRSAGSGVRGSLALIGVAAHEAAAAGLWWRLKVCSSDECEWAYYDHSKNRSRSWCEYGCGNRLKTRAYRARRRAASG